MMPVELAVHNPAPIACLPELVIVPTTAAHIRELKDTIREKDRIEVEKIWFTCQKGLWKSYKNGMMNQTALVNGKVAACWGVCGTYLSDIGAPWLLTSYKAEEISPLRFAKIYQREVYRMLEIFPRLESYVDSSYLAAVRLLSIIGFTVDEPENTRNGLFSKYHMERHI